MKDKLRVKRGHGRLRVETIIKSKEKPQSGTPSRGPQGRLISPTEWKRLVLIVAKGAIPARVKNRNELVQKLAADLSVTEAEQILQLWAKFCAVELATKEAALPLTVEEAAKKLTKKEKRAAKQDAEVQIRNLLREIKKLLPTAGRPLLSQDKQKHQRRLEMCRSIIKEVTPFYKQSPVDRQRAISEYLKHKYPRQDYPNLTPTKRRMLRGKKFPDTLARGIVAALEGCRERTIKRSVSR